MTKNNKNPSLSFVSLQLVPGTNLLITPAFSLSRSHTLALQLSALPILPCFRSHASVVGLCGRSIIAHSTSLPTTSVEVPIPE